MWFVVMNNIFPIGITIHERFDLKVWTVGVGANVVELVPFSGSTGAYSEGERPYLLLFLARVRT